MTNGVKLVLGLCAVVSWGAGKCLYKNPGDYTIIHIGQSNEPIWACEQQRERIYQYKFSWRKDDSSAPIQTPEQFLEVFQLYARVVGDAFKVDSSELRDEERRLEWLLSSSYSAANLTWLQCMSKIFRLGDEVSMVGMHFDPYDNERYQRYFSENRTTDYKEFFDRCDAVAAGIFYQVERDEILEVHHPIPSGYYRPSKSCCLIA